MKKLWTVVCVSTLAACSAAPAASLLDSLSHSGAFQAPETGQCQIFNDQDELVQTIPVMIGRWYEAQGSKVRCCTENLQSHERCPNRYIRPIVRVVDVCSLGTYENVCAMH